MADEQAAWLDSCHWTKERPLMLKARIWGLFKCAVLPLVVGVGKLDEKPVEFGDALNGETTQEVLLKTSKTGAQLSPWSAPGMAHTETARRQTCRRAPGIHR